ncbi:MAG: polysaccharide biosynthesis C-terminal domain-containing protein [Candidatus Lindowbacteria bacterium]|nr:polysaccharide biosynthesis C-terminal domain-containing protein [Candidatus Lindowbacteria bacterium]
MKPRLANSEILPWILQKLSVPEDFARLSLDTVYYGVGKSAEALAALVLVPVLTRAFTPAQFGLWDVTMTFFLLTTTTASLALEAALAAFYFETQQADERMLVASTSLLSRLASSVLVAIPIFFLAPQISLLIFDTAVYSACFRILAAAIPFFLMINMQKQLLRIDFAPGKFNVLSVGFAGLYTTLGVIFVLNMKMGVKGILFAMLVAGVCSALVGSRFVSKFSSFEFSSGKMAKMLVFAVPLIPYLLANWVIDSSSRYFLTKLSTLEQVGIYSVGAKISSIITLFVTSFQMAWAPAALSIQHQPGAKEKFSRALLFFVAVSLTAATAITVFARPILVVLTQPTYYGAERVIGLLSFSLVVYGAFLMVSIGLIIVKKTALASAGLVAGAIVNLLLNYLLIPVFGMLGAALATFISYSAAAALLYRFTQKHYPVDYKIPRLARLAALSAGTLALAWLLPFDGHMPLDVASRVILMVGFVVILKKLLIRAGQD